MKTQLEIEVEMQRMVNQIEKEDASGFTTEAIKFLCTMELALQHKNSELRVELLSTALQSFCKIIEVRLLRTLLDGAAEQQIVAIPLSDLAVLGIETSNKFQQYDDQVGKLVNLMKQEIQDDVTDKPTKEASIDG